MPQMNVEGIKKVLAEGGSVFVRTGNGEFRHVIHPGQVPTEAELAKGDEEAANLTLDTSREVGGFKKGQFEALEKKIESLMVEAQKREASAAKDYQGQIEELKAKLAAIEPQAAKPAPAPVAPVAPPRAPEVKAK